MNKGLIFALCLGLLPGPQLKANTASETAERQLRKTSPSVEDRRGFGKRVPRRPRAAKETDTATQTPGLVGGIRRLGSKDHAGSTSGVNATSSPNFAANLGKSLSQSWSDFLRSVSHSSNSRVPTSSDRPPRVHYSTPEPGIFLELGLLLAGFGLNAIRRRQPKC